MNTLSIIKTGALIIGFIGLTACNSNNTSPNNNDLRDIENGDRLKEETVKEKSITVYIQPKSNSELSGKVTFTENEGVVTMKGEFSGLQPNGTHAIHLHEHADCSNDDGTSTGDHWNPNDEPHGKWNDKKGFHAGDIGNLEADEHGHATLLFETDQWCIDCSDDTKNIIGTGIIIHESKDDFHTQPTGDAGGRIGCGEIQL